MNINWIILPTILFLFLFIEIGCVLFVQFKTAKAKPLIISVAVATVAVNGFFLFEKSFIIALQKENLLSVVKNRLFS